MSDIWFTADTHFDHDAILRHTDRHKHFATVEDMNDALIDAINLYVKPHDLLVIAGDVFWKRPGHFRQRMRARNIWVTQGNHDSNSLRKHVSRMELMFFMKKQRLHVCHYPLESWWAKEHDSVHLHGHSHGRMRLIENRIDVGLDAVFARVGEWRPVCLDEIFNYGNEVCYE